MSEITRVLVPNIGDSQNVEIIEVHIKKGEAIELESPLITLESDKATMDVPSPLEGQVKSVEVKVGDKVSEGDLILFLETQSLSNKKRGSLGKTVSSDTVALETQTINSSPSSTKLVQEPKLILMPEMGEFDEVDIIDVLVKPGDFVNHEDPVITLESDKATMDVPSPLTGTIQEIMVSAGEKISKGQKIALIVPQKDEGQNQGVSQDTVLEKENSDSVVKLSSPKLGNDNRVDTILRSPPVSTEIDQQKFLKAHASPSARQFARELGVDLYKISGSGRKGRITREDIQLYVKQKISEPVGMPSSETGIPSLPIIDFAQFGEVEVQPLSRIKKKGAMHLHRAWLNIPMVTNHDEADITELEAFRQRLKKEASEPNIRVTMLAFLLKASAANLKKFPFFCASLDSDREHIILKKYCHIGVAVDTEEGLLVPVIRDVNLKSIYELAEELVILSEKARNRKLKLENLEGGCFSISSLGGIAGTGFTPLVNAPEVAILGVSRSRMMPQWDGQEFRPRLMLPLDLSYDHRVIDGAAAARFLAELCLILSDMRRLLL